MNAREMIEYILQQRRDLTESKLLELVAEKKEEVGAGYLTDQGALFLVAADLGIDVERENIELSLKDLYAGIREITLVSRILKIYPIKRIERSDGSVSMLRTLVIYDNDATARLTLWDAMATLPDTLGLKHGDAIRINRAYTRSTPDGKVSLSTSSKSKIELIEDDVQYIRSIEKLAIDIKEISERDNLVINAEILSPPRISSFINNKGEKSRVLHMKINSSNEMRVIIWNVDENSLPKIIKRGDKAFLIGFRAKRNQFGDIELHGDEGSKIMMEKDREEPDIIQIRIISLEERGDEILALVMDKDNPYLLLSSLSIDGLEIDRYVECVPSRIYGNTIILDRDSYVRVLDEADIPSPSTLEVKINEIKPDEDTLYFLEAITLLPVKIQEVIIKNESVNYAETLLGDDSGEIRLVAWRETAKMIENLSTGRRIKVYGASASVSRDGKPELRLKPYSKIMVVS